MGGRLSQFCFNLAAAMAAIGLLSRKRD